MNPILGRVVLDRKGVENSWGHGPGRFKAAAFAAVPDVIAKGRIIDRQTNWKKRGYNTVVLVAPVKIGKDARVVAVVVEQRKDNRFYLHEAYLKESLQKGLSFKTGALLEPGASTGDIEKIVRHIFSVNPESVSKRVDQNGEPLPDAVDGDLALFAPQQINGTPEQEAIRERVSTDLLDRRPLGQRISEWFSDRSERAQEKSIIGLFDNLAGIRFAIERAYGKGAADLMDAIMNPWKFAHATTREIRTMFEGWFGSDRIVGGTYRYENGDIIHNKGSKGLRAILSQLVTKDGSLMKLWESYVTAYRGNQVTLQ